MFCFVCFVCVVLCCVVLCCVVFCVVLCCVVFFTFFDVVLYCVVLCCVVFHLLCCCVVLLVKRWETGERRVICGEDDKSAKPVVNCLRCGAQTQKRKKHKYM